MAGWQIQVEVTGLDAARRVAQRVANLGESPQPLLEIAGAILEASTRRRFDEQHGPGGVPWPPSKAAQGLVKRASGAKAAGKTLVDTGDLEGSIRHEVREDEVEVGVDARGGGGSTHAAALQYGSHRQTVVLPHYRVVTQAFGVPLPEPVTVAVRAHGMITNLPARPFVGVDDDDRSDLAGAWNDHLLGLFNAA